MLHIVMIMKQSLCRQKSLAEQASQRQSAVGTGDRSERIRTYNFQENRITDHRIGVSVHGMQDMLAGLKLDTFIDKLREQDERDRMMAMLQTSNFGL